MSPQTSLLTIDGSSYSTESQGARGIELDLCGLKCPMPVLRTRKALRALEPGAELVVLCTDPLAVIDIPHLVHQDGHRIARQTQAEGVAIFVIVKGPVRIDG